ncbi:MAG: hypothetical protein Ct9H300mP19_04400 [Dehalococcoidia bacterium]|nr:MAG: hypothetical protein Ct9H300mP19_04400 [Dehalococcoidia bacterium]
MILSNDPYGGGVHLNDISLIGPVHWQGQLVGYTACLAHHVDVGGGAPASVGAFREVFQEGIIIPPIKFVDHGKLDDDLFRLVSLANPIKTRNCWRLPRTDCFEPNGSYPHQRNH